MAQRTPDTADTGQGGQRTPDSTGQAPAVSAPPLTAREAAAVAGVSERTIRRAVARGELPAGKHAGAYRIAPADVAAWGGGPDTGQLRPRRTDRTPVTPHPAHQGAEIARLAAVAALWQERARVLEGRLRALGAGDAATPDDQAAAASPAPTRRQRLRRRLGGG